MGLRDEFTPWIWLPECLYDAFGGLDVMCVADHVCNQVQAKHLAEFILPFEKAAFDEFPQTVKIYHN
jgi:hypothetical protein